MWPHTTQKAGRSPLDHPGHICCRFGPSPSSSYKTQDSASSFEGRTGPRRKPQGLSGKQEARPAPCEKKGRSSSLDTGHSVGSAESQPALLSSSSARRAPQRPATPSPSLPMQSYRSRPAMARCRAPNAFDPSTLPGLGTWAQRQFRFQPGDTSESEEPAGAPAAQLPTPPAPRRSPRRSTEGDEDERAARAAWRWRFNRRCCRACCASTARPAAFRPAASLCSCMPCLGAW